MNGLTFAVAVEILLAGGAVRREGWNGQGMKCFAQFPDKHSKMTHPYLVMVIPDCIEGERLLPWQPSQVDIFANDWEELR